MSDSNETGENTQPNPATDSEGEALIDNEPNEENGSIHGDTTDSREEIGYYSDQTDYGALSPSDNENTDKALPTYEEDLQPKVNLNNYRNVFEFLQEVDNFMKVVTDLEATRINLIGHNLDQQVPSSPESMRTNQDECQSNGSFADDEEEGYDDENMLAARFSSDATDKFESDAENQAPQEILNYPIIETTGPEEIVVEFPDSTVYLGENKENEGSSSSTLVYNVEDYNSESINIDRNIERLGNSSDEEVANGHDILLRTERSSNVEEKLDVDVNAMTDMGMDEGEKIGDDNNETERDPALWGSHGLKSEWNAYMSKKREEYRKDPKWLRKQADYQKKLRGKMAQNPKKKSREWWEKQRARKKRNSARTRARNKRLGIKTTTKKESETESEGQKRKLPSRVCKKRNLKGVPKKGRGVQKGVNDKNPCVKEEQKPTVKKRTTRNSNKNESEAVTEVKSPKNTASTSKETDNDTKEIKKELALETTPELSENAKNNNNTETETIDKAIGKTKAKSSQQHSKPIVGEVDMISISPSKSEPKQKNKPESEGGKQTMDTTVEGNTICSTDTKPVKRKRKKPVKKDDLQKEELEEPQTKRLERNEIIVENTGIACTINEAEGSNGNAENQTEVTETVKVSQETAVLNKQSSENMETTPKHAKGQFIDSVRVSKKGRRNKNEEDTTTFDVEVDELPLNEERNQSSVEKNGNTEAKKINNRELAKQRRKARRKEKAKNKKLEEEKDKNQENAVHPQEHTEELAMNNIQVEEHIDTFEKETDIIIPVGKPTTPPTKNDSDNVLMTESKAECEDQEKIKKKKKKTPRRKKTPVTNYGFSLTSNYQIHNGTATNDDHTQINDVHVDLQNSTLEEEKKDMEVKQLMGNEKKKEKTTKIGNEEQKPTYGHITPQDRSKSKGRSEENLSDKNSIQDNEEPVTEDEDESKETQLNIQPEDMNLEAGNEETKVKKKKRNLKKKLGRRDHQVVLSEVDPQIESEDKSGKKRKSASDSDGAPKRKKKKKLVVKKMKESVVELKMGPTRTCLEVNESETNLVPPKELDNSTVLEKTKHGNKYGKKSMKRKVETLSNQVPDTEKVTPEKKKRRKKKVTKPNSEKGKWNAGPTEEENSVNVIRSTAGPIKLTSVRPTQSKSMIQQNINASSATNEGWREIEPFGIVRPIMTGVVVDNVEVKDEPLWDPGYKDTSKFQPLVAYSSTDDNEELENQDDHATVSRRKRRTKKRTVETDTNESRSVGERVDVVRVESFAEYMARQVDDASDLPNENQYDRHAVGADEKPDFSMKIEPGEWNFTEISGENSTQIYFQPWTIDPPTQKRVLGTMYLGPTSSTAERWSPEPLKRESRRTPILKISRPCKHPKDKYSKFMMENCHFPLADEEVTLSEETLSDIDTFSEEWEKNEDRYSTETSDEDGQKT